MYDKKLGDLWSFETGDKYLGPDRSDPKIMRFKNDNTILIKLPMSHVENYLKQRNYDLNKLKMESIL